MPKCTRPGDRYRVLSLILFSMLLSTSHTERGHPLGAQEAHGSLTDTQARECFQCTTGMSWNRYEIALLFIVGLESLAAASLIQTVRRRIQTVIDRRFYRQKYDSQQTLQPEQVSLWLNQPHPTELR